jgi:phosphoribosylamine-glycine ligase
MNILLIGSGGREHALAAKLLESQSVNLYAAPGNPGILSLARVASVDVSDHADVVAFCKKQAIELADELHTAQVHVFGPTKAAAQIESSKGFAKEFMRRHNVPTAQFLRFTASQLVQVREYIALHALPVVIKADGLAAGKGVVVAETREQALLAIEEMLSGKFGDASESIIIEEFMQGEDHRRQALHHARRRPRPQAHRRRRHGREHRRYGRVRTSTDCEQGGDAKDTHTDYRTCFAGHEARRDDVCGLFVCRSDDFEW